MPSTRVSDRITNVLETTPTGLFNQFHGSLLLRYRRIDQRVAMQIDRFRKRCLRSGRIEQVQNELQETLTSLSQIQNVLPAADAERLDEMGKRLEWVLGRLRSS